MACRWDSTVKEQRAEAHFHQTMHHRAKDGQASCADGSPWYQRWTGGTYSGSPRTLVSREGAEGGYGPHSLIGPYSLRRPS